MMILYTFSSPHLCCIPHPFSFCFVKRETRSKPFREENIVGVWRCCGGYLGSRGVNRQVLQKAS
jgi:hypothetical protein